MKIKIVLQSCEKAEIGCDTVSNESRRKHCSWVTVSPFPLPPKVREYTVHYNAGSRVCNFPLVLVFETTTYLFLHHEEVLLVCSDAFVELASLSCSPAV